MFELLRYQFGWLFMDARYPVADKRVRVAFANAGWKKPPSAGEVMRLMVTKVEGDIAYAIKTGEIRSDGRRHDEAEIVTDLTNAGFADGDDDSDFDRGDNSDRDGDEGGNYLDEK